MALPLVIMAWMMLGSTANEILTLKERQQGARYSALIRMILQDVQQHRALSVNVLNGDASYSGAMQEKQAEILKDFQEAEAFEGSIQNFLRSSGELK